MRDKIFFANLHQNFATRKHYSLKPSPKIERFLAQSESAAKVELAKPICGSCGKALENTSISKAKADHVDCDDFDRSDELFDDAHRFES